MALIGPVVLACSFCFLRLFNPTYEKGFLHCTITLIPSFDPIPKGFERMDHVALPLARRPFGRLPCSRISQRASAALLSRPVPPLLGSRRWVSRSAALSDGGSQVSRYLVVASIYPAVFYTTLEFIRRREELCSSHLPKQSSPPLPQGTSAALNPKLVEDTAASLEFSDNPHTRSAPSLKGERERINAGDRHQSCKQSSWDDWLRHFDAMDELAEDAAHYQVR